MSTVQATARVASWRTGGHRTCGCAQTLELSGRVVEASCTLITGHEGEHEMLLTGSTTAGFPKRTVIQW